MLWVTEKHPVVDDNCVFITKPKPWGYRRGQMIHRSEATVRKSSVPLPSEVPLWLHLWSQQTHKDDR